MNICCGNDTNDVSLIDNFDKTRFIISKAQFEFDGNYKLINDEGDDILVSKKNQIDSLKKQIKIKDEKIDILKIKIRDLDEKLKDMYKVIIMDDKEQQYIDTLGKLQEK